MRLKVLFLLLFIVFLIACAPEKVTEEEIFSELDNLSSEELDAVMAEKALAGQAIRDKPVAFQRKVADTRKKIARLQFLDCEDSDRGESFTQQGEVRIQYSLEGRRGERSLPDTCAREKLTEYSCNGPRFATTTHTCEYGCREGACLPEPVTPPTECIPRKCMFDDRTGLPACGPIIDPCSQQVIHCGSCPEGTTCQNNICVTN